MNHGKPIPDAVDAGTGSVRAVLFNEDGAQVSCVQREWTHAEDPRYPGSMDFDWVHNWELASECIRGAIAEAGVDAADIAAVSTTCMREGIVLYDEAGQEIWACANVDARSDDEVGQLIRMNPELEKEIYRESGQTYALGALPRILWVKNKLPELYARVKTVSMFNDWLIYKLTGVLKTEPSNGCTTGIFDLQKRRWDARHHAQGGPQGRYLPARGRVRRGGQPGQCQGRGGHGPEGRHHGRGRRRRRAAGLHRRGRGGQRPGRGLWRQLLAVRVQHRQRQDRRGLPRARQLPCRARLWQYEALAFKPGLVMRWYRDAFCQEEVRRARELGTDPYQLMNEQAAKVPAGSYGMMCAFSDVMNYIAWRHASPTFTNFDFDPEKFNKYTFYRAIMENTAMVTRGHLELVREATGNAPQEIVFAGGASKGDIWCQILADVLGLPVKVPVVKEATALGAAILAGYGVGVFTDISATRAAWSSGTRPSRPTRKTIRSTSACTARGARCTGRSSSWPTTG